VDQPSEISLTAQVSATNCPGSNNGAIDLTVTGGTPACTFLWSNGASTEDLTGLDAGDYTVTVTDANGCLKTGTWTVVQTTPVCDSISVSGTVTTTVCYNALNTITVAGGGSTFAVQAAGSATFIAGQNILFLPGTSVQEGGYLHGYITLTNEYCGSIPPPLVAVKTGTEENSVVSEKLAFRVYPNPTTGSFTIEMTGVTTPEATEIEIYGIRGNRVIKTNLSGASKQVISLEDQPSGLYFIRLMSEGTSATGKIIKN
jgi:hypothetical protein